MILKPHETKLDARNNGDIVKIYDASPESVETVLAADPSSPDGRSQFVWVRMPNGDLMLAVFPQGDTYFTVEEDAAHPGPIDDILWCEECGERPQMVHTDHAGLCCHCAAATIDSI